MNISIFPDRIKITIGLDAATRALIERILDVQDGTIQKQIDALTARLTANRTKIIGSLVPDPNPND